MRKSLPESKEAIRTLPHGNQFRFVYQVFELDDEHIKAQIRVPFLMAWIIRLCHFRGNPIVPGTTLLEAIAQVGAIMLLARPGNKGKIILNSSISGEFDGQVRLDDHVMVHVWSCQPDDPNDKRSHGMAEALVGDKKMVTARIAGRPMRADITRRQKRK